MDFYTLSRDVVIFDILSSTNPFRSRNPIRGRSHYFEDEPTKIYCTCTKIYLRPFWSLRLLSFDIFFSASRNSREFLPSSFQNSKSDAIDTNEPKQKIKHFKYRKTIHYSKG